jgi:outer membrane protein assembly factor BamA
MKAKKSLFLGLITFILAVKSSPLSAQKDSAKKDHLLLFPVIAKSIETGWEFGGASSFTFHTNKNDTSSRTSSIQAVAIYSTRKQIVAAINGTQYFKKEKFILTEQFSYSSFPDQFWGLGKNTPDSAVEPYQFQQFYIYAHLMRKIAPKLFVGGIFEFQNVWDIQYVKGGLFDKENIPGRNGYRVSGLGSSITYDSRNDAFAPSQGFFAQFFFNHFNPIFGSDFTYTNLVVDLRKFIPIKKGQVLALQLYSFNNSGVDIPIRSLAALGGASQMRGFYSGRYRDHQQMVTQAEYRVAIKKRLGIVAFGGVGNVNKQFSDASFEHLKYSYGAGIRFALNKSEKLNIRLDYGIGGGNNRGFYLQLGEAF